MEHIQPENSTFNLELQHLSITIKCQSKSQGLGPVPVMLFSDTYLRQCYSFNHLLSATLLICVFLLQEQSYPGSLYSPAGITPLTTSSQLHIPYGAKNMSKLVLPSMMPRTTKGE